MTNRSDDPWNRSNDPWNRDRSWEAYPSTEDTPSVSDPEADTPEIRGYPVDATPPTSTSPTSATPSPTSATPPPTSPVSPGYPAYPAQPTGALPPATPAVGTRRSSSKARLRILAAVAVPAIAVVLVVSFIVARSAPTTTLPTVWSLSSEDFLPGEYSVTFSDALDGTEGTGVLVTDDVWVALLTDRRAEPEGAPSRLVGIEPEDGTVSWERELPGAVCADRPGDDGTLTCLSEQPEGTEITEVDLGTGEVAESFPVEGVVSPRQMHLTADGILVVGQSAPRVHSQLTHLAADGTVRWSTDLAQLVGGETLFTESPADDGAEEVTLKSGTAWVDVGDSVLLGSDSFVHIVPDTERVQVHQGRSLAVVDDRFFYQTSPGSVGYDATGEKVWYQREVDLIRSTEGGPARSLLHLGSTDSELRVVDPATGDVSGPFHTFEERSGSPRVGGPADQAYVFRGEEVLRLSPEGDSVLWATEVSGANSISQGLTVDGATVVTASALTGLDPDTGEELWTADVEGRAQVADGRLLVADRRTLTLHTLP